MIKKTWDATVEIVGRNRGVRTKIIRGTENEIKCGVPTSRGEVIKWETELLDHKKNINENRKGGRYNNRPSWSYRYVSNPIDDEKEYVYVPIYQLRYAQVTLEEQQLRPVRHHLMDEASRLCVCVL